MRNPCPSGLRASTLVLALLLLASTLLPAHAQWKWRDKNGQITASDLPPPRGVADKDILQRPDTSARQPAAASPPASAPAPAAPAAAPADRDLEARKQAAEQAAEQDAKARAKADETRLAAQRAENCGRARAHASALESGQRIARVNAQGEREVLDDKGRAEEMQRVRKVIASECK
jgi:type IV secretory pathway VirB10-like protein